MAGQHADRARGLAGALHRPVPDARRRRRRTRPTRPASGTRSRRAPRRPAAATASRTSGRRATSPGSTRASARTSTAAYQQLLQYREALENPPLLVVCDLNRFEIHTNFTNTPAAVHAFTLDDLLDGAEEPLRVLRAVMLDPEELRPARPREELTAEAAQQFATLAVALRDAATTRSASPTSSTSSCSACSPRTPGSSRRASVERLTDAGRGRPRGRSPTGLSELFEQDVQDGGGLFGAERIQWFNGGLFDGADVLPMERSRLDVVRAVARLDWSQVEPAIFGTLFERGLDPASARSSAPTTPIASRSCGWSSRSLMAPLRREFEAMKERVEDAARRGQADHVARRRLQRNPTRVFKAFLRAPARRPRARSRRAARATSSTSRCSCSRTSSAKRSSGARSPSRRRCSSRRSVPGGARHRDQPLRRRARPRRRLDRRDPVDAQQRLRLPARSRSSTRSHNIEMPRCAPRPHRPRATPSSRTGPTPRSSSATRRSSGGKLPAGRARRRRTSMPCSSVYDGRVPREADFVTLLAREGARDGRGRHASSASACSRRRASAAARTAASLSGSRRRATSSSPGRTRTGSSKARQSTSPSSATTTAPSKSGRSTASRSPRSTPT